MRYKFKNPEFLPIKNAKEADAQRLGEAIAAIEARDGEVKTDAIWEAAKDRRHPFHKHIDWDKDDASEKWQPSVSLVGLGTRKDLKLNNGRGDNHVLFKQ